MESMILAYPSDQKGYISVTFSPDEARDMRDYLDSVSSTYGDHSQGELLQEELEKWV